MKGNLINKERLSNLNSFSRKLGFQFHNYNLLNQAFIHSSYSNEHLEQQLSDNECLEFLGDSVLNLTVSEFLYNTVSLDEGSLSYFKRILVSNDFLSEISNRLYLDSYLLLGKSLAKKELSKKIQANVLEAFLCVIYIEQGYESVKFFLLPFLKEKLEEIQKLYSSCRLNYKVKLQEFTQKKWNTLPIYEIKNIIQMSNYQIFTTKVRLPIQKYQATGQGKSKKQSEVNAASNLINKFKIE